MQKITLEKIHHDIVEWRKTKKYKCEPIPQQIWESIRQINKECESLPPQGGSFYYACKAD